MKNKTSYEIDFLGRDSVTDVSKKIVSGVLSAQGIITESIGKVSSGLESQAAEAAAGANKIGSAIKAVASGAVQAVSTGVKNVAARLLTTTKITELWTAAQTKLTTAIGASTVAAKAFTAAITMGAAFIISGAIIAISKYIDKKRELKKATEAAKQAEIDARKSVQSTVAGSIAAQLVSYRSLQQEWKSLNGNAAKQAKFIKDNAKEFKKLGVQVGSVKDAENVLIKNEDAFVESLKHRAMAAAAMELASKKYQSAIEKMLQAEDAKKVTDGDKKNARLYAEGVYQDALLGAKGAMGRGGVVGQRDQIINDAYASNIKSYGEARAAAYQEASNKEKAEGDRYFTIVSQQNKVADDILKTRGIRLGKDGDLGGKAGSIDAIEKKIQALTKAQKTASVYERAELQKDINAWKKKLEAVNLELEALEVPADPKTLQELDTAISYYNKLLKVAGAEERADIQQTINGYEKKKTAIEDSLKAIQMPSNPSTFEEYSKAVSILEAQLAKASASERSGIQATIDALKREEGEQKARLALATTPAVLESIYDYEQAISACEDVLRFAGEEERAIIQKRIDDYRRKKEAIEDTLDALDTPHDPKSLEDFDKVLSALQRKLQKAGEDERAGIQASIDAYKAKKAAIEASLSVAGNEALASMVQNGLGIDTELEVKLRAKVIGAEIAKQKIQELQQMSIVAESDEDRAAIQNSINAWRKYALNLDSAQTSGQKAAGTLSGLSSVAGSISGVVDEGAAGWLQWGSNVMSAIAQALPSIAQVIGGNVAQAFSGAIAQSQAVPFPLNLVALATNLAAVGAAVASIPKFAEGAIAYGPTLGLFGEYANAANDPEVVGKLSDLTRLIAPAMGMGDGKVEFVLRGRDLYGSYESYSRYKRRNG